MGFKEDFKIDLVIGNPPYNNGMDIDFIMLGHELGSIGSSFVVPAKWQTADESQRIDSNNNYGDFRKVVVPHISEIVYYPDAAEIFEIRNIDGITWYFSYKDREVDKCNVKNFNLHQKYFVSEETRSIRHRESLHNIGFDIIQEIGEIEQFRFQNNISQYRYQVSTSNKINCGCGWGYTNRNDPYSLVTLSGSFKCIGSSVIVDNYNCEKDDRGASAYTFGSDDKQECENFISWINTKLVRFLIAVNIGKLTAIFTDDYFRFVPKPFKGFSQKYTDNEMYEHYKISKEHVDAIESIILDI